MKNCIKKSLKTSNGITLIALVITIIVLLILAGISISMLSGDNTILQKATDAKQTSERAEAKEQAQMDIMAWITDKTANHQDASLDDSIVQGILEKKSYVKEAKDTSFITAKGEYEIPYSELYAATTPTIKYGLQEDGVTFITAPGSHETDGKTYQIGTNDGEIFLFSTASNNKLNKNIYWLCSDTSPDGGYLYDEEGLYLMTVMEAMGTGGIN